MKTTELQQQIQQLGEWTPEQKAAILHIIDLKTNNDMKEVVQAINALKTEMDYKFDVIEKRFLSVEKLIYGVLITFIVSVVTSIVLNFLK